MYRANKNARAFGCTGLQFSPGTAAGMWYVPILSLFMPYQAVKELWKASTWEHQVPWEYAPTPAFLPIWWGAFIVFMIAAQIARKVEATAESSPSAVISVLHTRQLASVLAIVAGALCILVVRGLAQRFQRRADQLRGAEAARAAG